MKRILLILTALFLILSLSACSFISQNKEEPGREDSADSPDTVPDKPSGEDPAPGGNKEKEEEPEPVPVDLIGIRGTVEEITASALDDMTAGKEAAMKAAGGGFGDYDAHKQDIFDWMDDMAQEADNAFADIRTTVEDGLRQIIGQTAAEPATDWLKALDELTSIWNEAADRYFSGWENALEDAYEKLGKLADGDGSGLSGAELAGVHSDCWSGGFRAYTSLYTALKAEQVAVREALATGKEDPEEALDTVKQQIDAEEAARREEERKKKEEEEKQKQQEQEEETAETTPEIRAQLDSYVAFFEENAAFIQEFRNSADPTGMMSAYMAYQERSDEIFRALDAIDTDTLNEEDRQYLEQIRTRIDEILDVTD